MAEADLARMDGPVPPSVPSILMSAEQERSELDRAYAIAEQALRAIPTSG